MDKPIVPDTQPILEAPLESTPESNETVESFGQLLSEFEKTHSRKAEDSGKQIDATVIAVDAESAFLDIGFKTEGILPLANLVAAGEAVKPGDKFLVSVKGRNAEGYYELSRIKVAQPKDWSALEQAFADKSNVVGTVTAVIKGGLSVDVGVRAFMPASRSGTRDAGELEKMVGQEILCRIIKLDVQDEDVVVDRRAVVEEEERSTKERLYNELKEGDTVHGEVRSLTDYGAFIDIGGIDGLIHVSDMSWSRVANPADVLTVGQQIDARVLKIDAEKRRISLGLKQLQPQPWDAVPEKFKNGDRVKGVVTRVADFGAFVELEPGIEGLIHVSEMSWARKVRKASDVVKPGDTVEAVILGINLEERRISLGLKQALGDPWVESASRISVGSQVEGPITSLMKFGAFMQVAEGVEGMIHVSEISADKHINHPQDVLKVGQQVKALVLEVDAAKRQLRLSIKQLIPTGLDEYIAEHKEGDVVTGRMIDESHETATVELGEGIRCSCRIPPAVAVKEEPKAEQKSDLSALSAMLKTKWKGGAVSASPKHEAARAGQIRSFRITKLDAETKKIEVELA